MRERREREGRGGASGRAWWPTVMDCTLAVFQARGWLKLVASRKVHCIAEVEGRGMTRDGETERGWRGEGEGEGELRRCSDRAW